MSWIQIRIQFSIRIQIRLFKKRIRNSISVYFHLQCSMGCLVLNVERKEERMRTEKGELYELLYTEIVKYRTIRLASGLQYCTDETE